MRIEDWLEYRAYRTQKEITDNMKEGLQVLEAFERCADGFQIPEQYRKYCGLESYRNNKETIIIAGAMAAFDKGSIHFLNALKEENRPLQFFLLSEVTAQYRRKTAGTVRMPFLCTPHILSKEIMIPGVALPMDSDMEEVVGSRTYLMEAVENLNLRHPDLGDGYAKVLVFHYYRYLIKLLAVVQPVMVILWNEFYAFHHIFRHICIEKDIPVRYMEFGCIPGTFVLEKYGQQGESEPARYPEEFNRLEVTEEEVKQAEKILYYLKSAGLNRNRQPIFGDKRRLFRLKKTGRPVITYMGQNDFESGLQPYHENSRKYHSPMFRTSMEALAYLEILSIKNNFTLLFKPHPIMEKLHLQNENELEKAVKIADININTIIDMSDAVVTILSQSAYIALIRKRPVVMLGYTQLLASGAVYNAFNTADIEGKLELALQEGFTKEQENRFTEHTARVLKYYLYDDRRKRKIRYGKQLLEII